jgi:hypothetical protein
MNATHIPDVCELCRIRNSVYYNSDSLIIGIGPVSLASCTARDDRDTRFIADLTTGNYLLNNADLYTNYKNKIPTCVKHASDLFELYICNASKQPVPDNRRNWITSTGTNSLITPIRLMSLAKVFRVSLKDLETYKKFNIQSAAAAAPAAPAAPAAAAPAPSVASIPIGDGCLRICLVRHGQSGANISDDGTYHKLWHAPLLTLTAVLQAFKFGEQQLPIILNELFGNKTIEGCEIHGSFLPRASLTAMLIAKGLKHSSVEERFAHLESVDCNIKRIGHLTEVAISVETQSRWMSLKGTGRTINLKQSETYCHVLNEMLKDDTISLNTEEALLHDGFPCAMDELDPIRTLEQTLEYFLLMAPLIFNQNKLPVIVSHGGYMKKIVKKILKNSNSYLNESIRSNRNMMEKFKKFMNKNPENLSAVILKYNGETDEWYVERFVENCGQTNGQLLGPFLEDDDPLTRFDGKFKYKYSFEDYWGDSGSINSKKTYTQKAKNLFETAKGGGNLYKCVAKKALIKSSVNASGNPFAQIPLGTVINVTNTRKLPNGRIRLLTKFQNQNGRMQNGWVSMAKTDETPIFEVYTAREPEPAQEDNSTDASADAGADLVANLITQSAATEEASGIDLPQELPFALNIVATKFLTDHDNITEIGKFLFSLLNRARCPKLNEIQDFRVLYEGKTSKSTAKLKSLMDELKQKQVCVGCVFIHGKYTVSEYLCIEIPNLVCRYDEALNITPIMNDANDGLTAFNLIEDKMAPHISKKTFLPQMPKWKKFLTCLQDWDGGPGCRSWPAGNLDPHQQIFFCNKADVLDVGAQFVTVGKTSSDGARNAETLRTLVQDVGTDQEFAIKDSENNVVNPELKDDPFWGAPLNCYAFSQVRVKWKNENKASEVRQIAPPQPTNRQCADMYDFLNREERYEECEKVLLKIIPEMLTIQSNWSSDEVCKDCGESVKWHPIDRHTCRKCSGMLCKTCAIEIEYWRYPGTQITSKKNQKVETVPTSCPKKKQEEFTSWGCESCLAQLKGNHPTAQINYNEYKQKAFLESYLKGRGIHLAETNEIIEKHKALFSVPVPYNKRTLLNNKNIKKCNDKNCEICDTTLPVTKWGDWHWCSRCGMIICKNCKKTLGPNKMKLHLSKSGATKHHIRKQQAKKNGEPNLIISNNQNQPCNPAYTVCILCANYLETHNESENYYGKGGKKQRKTPAKKPTKKPSAKKTTAKKPTAKKPTTKKSTAKNPTAKKPVAKKPVAKKPTAKKPTVKKSTAKKPTAKKPTAKKPIAKKTTAKKPVKKIRKHQGIYQRGDKKGKLKPGFKYSSKKTKTGLKIIVQVKKK